MPWLKYYAEERVAQKAAFAEVLSEADLRRAFNRLNRHYKLGYRLVIAERHGMSWCHRDYVLIRRNMMNVGVLAHELAHARQYRKRDRLRSKARREGRKLKRHNWHNREHKRYMEQMLSYIEAHKRHWLRDAVSR